MPDILTLWFCGGPFCANPVPPWATFAPTAPFLLVLIVNRLSLSDRSALLGLCGLAHFAVGLPAGRLKVPLRCQFHVVDPSTSRPTEPARPPRA